MTDEQTTPAAAVDQPKVELPDASSVEPTATEPTFDYVENITAFELYKRRLQTRFQARIEANEDVDEDSEIDAMQAAITQDPTILSEIAFFFTDACLNVAKNQSAHARLQKRLGAKS